MHGSLIDRQDAQGGFFLRVIANGNRADAIFFKPFALITVATEVKGKNVIDL